ncbi:MAG TPA: peptide deformylase [Candidatus Woesebacteria bacterium]|nr:peptide deformylase [Candidatus Woesebacteria bacterium]
MKIITAPNPVLRQRAKKVTVFDKKFFKFLDELANTLIKKENPRGVGLAAPQVNKSMRVFAVILGEKNRDSKKPIVEFFINPKITKYSDKKILGLADGSERFEGCLSVPIFYGPVPRYEWIEIEYQNLTTLDLRSSSSMPKIKNIKNRFSDFDARVIQHEYDHLEGILFTDHILKSNLPVYIDENDTFVEVKDKKAILGLL